MTSSACAICSPDTTPVSDDRPGPRAPNVLAEYTWGRGVNPRDSDHESRARPRRPGWWVRDRRGRLAVAQWPNAALWVWLAARVLGWADLTSLEEQTLRGIGTGALLVWALDELVRGASPFRRVMGAVVLGAQLWALFA